MARSERYVLGLTGMPGSGKSTARKILEDLGCHALDADALAHEVLGLPETLAKIATRFGEEVIKEGKLDRPAMAQRVFKDRKMLETLNSIVHPEVRRLARERIESAPAESIVVYDVPLLFETGLEKDLDGTLAIASDFPHRLERVRERGWSEEQLKDRDQHHYPDKAERADFVVDNNSDLQALRGQLEEVLQQIKKEVQK
ncbi:MAG: dephospho-CoA kinase [Leptospiraceae bacterium]|nr:dephospho-CoA kinase [Leptospiraceae bacterium]MCB1171187.1 dephospho-CoA kinase [Leptospiraceae bacterium]